MALRTGWPFLVSLSANAFGAAALFGCDEHLQRVAGSAAPSAATVPGPTRASADPPSRARWRRRGKAREERRREDGAGDDQRPRRRRAAAAASPPTRRAPARASRGFVRSRLTGREQPSPRASRPALTRITLPYEVCQSAASDRQVEHRRPDARCRAARAPSTNATFEKRGTATTSPATRSRRGQAAPEDEQADEPADPDRAGDEVQPVEQQRRAPRGAVWAGVAGDARASTSTAPAAASAPAAARSSATERCGRSGRSSQIAIHAATQKSAKQIPRST